jgi:pyrimidine operon attenuation protein/uracil phosphoribosyltransferase
MKILDSKQIQQKITRIAIEILENNFDESEIILAGINNNGMGFAKKLHKALTAKSDISFIFCQIRLNPADPLSAPITLSLSDEELHNKVIIIVDDVANTGRTIFYAFKPFLTILPKKVELAVLVNRKHKSFPVRPDYVGLSLATTAKENIDVQIMNQRTMEVNLD